MVKIKLTCGVPLHVSELIYSQYLESNGNLTLKQLGGPFSLAPSAVSSILTKGLKGL